MKQYSVMSFLFFISACLFMTMLLLTSPVESVTCDATQLSPCLGPIMSGKSTPECCSKLNEQKPCLCQYMKNPLYSRYINSSNGKKVASSCHVTIPTC
ncbi:hypothetical protein J5N97_027795 [Dioscorea zingiberensis]|uniref:Bifunctional inhibitor/plant lipid transfer protein/seed storage helical domain-containing protein n=1 Tax=Dioscorea zingiberensis TaxID=325984 RepID=A0A9D5H479_9LILI|nr:hypothetical protein J5N97_027795 [Dioscorea zingiberensis]